VTLPEFVAREKPAAVVTDMAPLRVPAGWVTDVAAALDLLLPPVPLVQVDAHNIVPVWVASDKQEVGARTIRRKINDRLPQYFTDFPALPPNPPSTPLPPAIEWDAELAALQIDRTVPEVDWLAPGAAAAQRVLDQFIAERLNVYHDLSNNPNESAQSDLSPYLHFGQLAPQRAALTIKHCTAHAAGKKAFLEQTIVRREVTDNYCFYNKHYDSLDGAAVWARDSLLLHASDKREYVYNREQLDRAKTHDPLWNAAQRQLLQTGKMHGFMRMYWAKKILEWSADPATALADAIYLNDRYNLDGRDPNGYVGCMWSICGIHDMGWKERPVFGKIRYMNYAGCKRKFKVAQFENRYPASKSGGLTKLFQKGEAGAGAATEGRKRKSSKAAATGGTAKKSK
jgi:deoxyribodipyrimidine photo-lyase